MNYRDENPSCKLFLLQCSKKVKNFLMESKPKGLLPLKYRIRKVLRPNVESAGCGGKMRLIRKNLSICVRDADS